VKALIDDGMASDKAESHTHEIYNRTERWMKDVIALGQSEFDGPSDFMDMFDRHLENEIDKLQRV
jgi:hypothetical protein